MRLSILIPMYNAKKFIGNCIESILSQSIAEEDYEIIIIDDGSKDNSVDLVKNYAKQHKNIILHQEQNSGNFSTRNKLLKLAKGDYIYNLDNDDYIAYNCLSDLLKIAESKQLDIIGFDTIETTSLDMFDLPESIDSKDIILSSGKEFIENNIHFRHELWCYFIKRNLVLKHDMSFSKNEYNADVVFILQALLKSKKVGYLPISIHRYVQTESSLMRSKNFDITYKRIEYMQMMINNKSKLINGLKKEPNSDILIENLCYRRDVFTFFNIINMLRNPFSLTQVKAKIKSFKAVGAYPIKNFNRHKYNSIKYSLLLALINSEALIYTFIIIKKLFLKPTK